MHEVDALHQQRPVARGQRREIGAAERAVGERPARAVAHDEPRFDVVAPREREESGAPKSPVKPAIAAADEQRFLLPVAPQKRRRREPAQRRAGSTGAIGRARAEAAIGRL